MLSIADRNPFTICLQSQCHLGRYPVDAMNNHDTDLVLLEYYGIDPTLVRIKISCEHQDLKLGKTVCMT